MDKNIIAMKELPKGCDKCRYCITKEYHPFWSKEKPNTKSFDCMLLENCEVLELDIKDETTKRDNCPIKQIDKLQNQKAIECLKEVKVKEMSCDGKKVPEKYIACFNAFIDNKIKELDGEE